MPVFQSRTRAQIRADVLALTGYGFQDTASAGAAGTVTLPRAKLDPDDTWNGMLAHITAGAGVGQVRKVTDHAQSTGVLTISPNWDTTPDSTSVVEVIEEWIGRNVARINDLINLAIQAAQEISIVRKRVNPVAITSDRRSCDVPAAVTHVSKVIYQTATTNVWEQYDLVQSPAWLEEADKGCALLGANLYFYPTLPSDVVVGDLWIVGYGKPALLSADATACDIRPDYVTFMTATYLELGNAQGRALDPEEHAGRAANWLRLGLEAQAKLFEYLDPDTQEVLP